MKVSITGIGKVGASIGFTLTLFEACDELVLVSRDPALAEAEALDLQHAASLGPGRMSIRAGGLPETAGSDVVVICNSVPSGPGDVTTRLELAEANWALFGDLVPQLYEQSPEAVFLVVSNPVDVLTYRALKLTGADPRRVLGTGTLIDSARYRWAIAQETGVRPADIRAYVLGEHGDSQFPAISNASIGGERADSPDSQWKLFREAAQSAYQVRSARGFTNYAIARAAGLLVHCIGKDTGHTMPVTTCIDGPYGVKDVCLSLPCVVGRGGISRVLRPDLSDEEAEAFRRSAQVVRQAIDACASSTT
ncbi:MAG: lactate dehydrogenase [Planctomycetota bacterium]